MASDALVRLAGASIAVTGACFVLGSAIHALLHAVMPGGYVFGAVYRMYTYHWVFPYQYIGVVALTYGGVFLLGAPVVSRLTGWRRPVAIVALMLATVVLASIPGGILWKIHDMQAGWVPEGERLWADLRWGATTGLTTGWFIVALSIPYNVVGLGLGYLVTDRALRFVHPSDPAGPPEP